MSSLGDSLRAWSKRVNPVDPIDRQFWQLGLTSEQTQHARMYLPAMMRLGFDEEQAVYLIGAAAAYFGADTGIPMAASYARQVLNKAERNLR